MMYPVLDARATGARIKELRKACHLRVEDVAQFMGFESEQAVYKWQRGDSLPTVDNLYALSTLFGVSVDGILRGSKEKDVDPSLPFFIKIKLNCSFMFNTFKRCYYANIRRLLVICAENMIVFVDRKTRMKRLLMTKIYTLAQKPGATCIPLDTIQ